MAKYPVPATIGATITDTATWTRFAILFNELFYYNVMNPDFSGGAKGDGSTNDTAAIQACIDASSPGDTIWFPVPDVAYMINAPIVYKPFRNYIALGNGWMEKAVIKVMNSSGGNFQSTSGHSGMFVPEGWNTNATAASGPVIIENLIFDGNQANNATGQHHGLVIYGEFWSRYRNLRAYNCRRSGIAMVHNAKNGTSSITLAGLSDSRFEDIFCTANLEHGFVQINSGAANHTDVVWGGTNLFFDNGLSGMYLDQAAGWKFNDMHFSGNGQHGLYILTSAFGVKIDGLYVENVGLTAAAGVSYFGFRAPVINGEPLEISNASVRVTDPAGTSLFYAYALEGTDTDGHVYLTNCHAIGANTSRGHGFNFNAGSTKKLTVHDPNSGVSAGAIGFVTGQDKEIIGSGTIEFNPPREITATATWDMASTATGGVASTTVTVTGANPGDEVLVAYSTLTQAGAIFISGRVTASNTVTVAVRNDSGSTIDPGSGTLRVTVRKRS